MSFDAGEVFAILGGRFNPAGFTAFERAMYQSRARAEDAEKRITGSMDRTSRAMHAVGQAAKVGAVAGIAGIGVAVGYSIKKAADFEQQLSSLQSVSGASAKQMAQLKKQAMDAGAATKYSALQAAQAQTELAKGGLTTAQIMGGGLKAALSLAAAGELDLADAATYTVNAMKLFKIRGEESTHVADALATAANQTTADVQDFGAALVQGGGAARSAGYDFDSTITLLEALAEAGTKNSDAGTSMKTALLQLIGPTKKQAEAAKSAGLSFLDQSGKMKSLVSISEMLRAKTGDMTKAQRTALFQTLAGTDGFRTLLALYDAGPEKLKLLEQATLRKGYADEVAAKKQDNFAGKLENFKGSIETAAIAVGSKLLPGLTRAAEKATDFVNHLSETGQLDRFGATIATGAAVAVRVLGDLVRVGGEVGGVLADIAGALDLGDPGAIEAIVGAIAGFKIAGIVAPIVMELVTAVRLLATAPTLGALATDLMAMVNPITAISLGAGAFVAALITMGRTESQEAQFARENAEAHREQAAAIQAVQDAELARADKGLGLKKAEVDLADARKRAHEAAMGPGGKNSEEYKRARLDEELATLRLKHAEDDYTQSIKDQSKANDDRVNKARGRIEQTQKELDALDKPRGGRANRNVLDEQQDRRAQLQENLTRRTREYVQALARQQVSELSAQRLMNASSQITEKNAGGIAKLIGQLKGVPAKKQTQLLLSGDQNTLARLGQLLSSVQGIPAKKLVQTIIAGDGPAKTKILALRAVIAGVPLQTVARILATTSGKAEVDALRAAIASVQSKQVTVAINTIRTTVARAITFGGNRGGRAAGRGVGASERALVGEGKVPTEWVGSERGGWRRVDEPTVMDLGPDDYVIPTDPRYRGRALQLLADAFGLGSYKAGKGGKKPKAKRVLPARPSNFRLSDPDDIRDDINKLDPISKERKQLKTGKKGPFTKRALEAQRELKTLRGLYRKAKGEADRIRGAEETAGNDYAALQLADKRDDQRGYDRALGDYKRHLKAEKDGLQRIYDALAKSGRLNTAWGRSVRGRLLEVKGKIEDAKDEKSQADQKAEQDAKDQADTGLTVDQQKRLEKLNADAALAALTKDLDDDKTAAQGIVDVLTEALKQDIAKGAPAKVIADVAGQLKAARDNLDSLNQTATEDANLQAQLEQQRSRADIAEANYRAQTDALRAFGSSGDIGTGQYANAFGAGANITINTLHPGDPQTLAAIASASSRSFDQQSTDRNAPMRQGY